MNDHERVIGLSLGAITEPSLWPRALLAFADVAGCAETTVIGYNALSGEMSFALVGGRIVDTEDLRPYLSYYGSLDPMRDVFSHLPSGIFAASHDALSTDLLARNEFIQDYLLPLGGRHYGGWSFTAADTHDVVGVALHGPDAPLESKACVPLSPLASHLARAIRQSVRVAEAEKISGSLKNALNKIGIAYVLVDDQCLILDASDPAIAGLESGQHLRIDHKGRLVAVSANDTARLRSLVADAAQGAQGGVLRLAANDRGVCAVLQIAPCGVTATNPFQSVSSRCALVLMRRAAGAAACEPGRVRAALNCSTAEAEIAAALASGRTPAQIAAARNVSINTVRTQIRALLAITETSRIADLVRLVPSLY